MDVNDPTMLGSIETQMMASVLHYGIQFLDFLPDDHRERLAQELVRDMRSTKNGAAFDQATVEQLTGSWFNRGRIYETLPEDALVPTADLARSATQLFLERVPLKLAEDALADLRSKTVTLLAETPIIVSNENTICRLLFLSFQ